MNRRDPSSCLSSPVRNTLFGERRLRPAGLAAAIGSVLGLALPGNVAAGDAGSSIATDGRTDTTVTRQGTDPRWKVTTTTVKGRGGNQVAFNSFRQFGVEAGQTVDLVLPTSGQQQVHNLVNLVTDARAYINGNLNSVLESTDAIGGKVFFVAPDGLLVGSSGVLNVGSLSVATANYATGDDILAAGDSLDALMHGTLKPGQLTGHSVQLDGTVNARNGIRVQARAIDVTGTLYVPAGARDANGDLQTIGTAVNAGGAQPLALVNDGGRIQLRAAAISDTGLGVRSANATVTVGGNADLQANDIELTALAEIDSGYDKDGALFDELKADLLNSVTDTDNLVDLGDALVNLGVDKLLGEQVSFLHGSTTARVEVKDNAVLTAREDIALHASTRQAIDNSAAGQAYEKGDVVTDANGDPVKDANGNTTPKKHMLSLGAAYAQINATTEAIVRSGATLTAGGEVAVKADADTALKLAAESFAVNNTTAAFTAAISNVNVDTRAVIERGAAALNAGSVNVSAVNTASIETSAIARADKNGAVGLAGAISLQDISAEARLDRDTTTTGDVTVQAASITALNKTSTLITGPKSEPLPGQEQVEAISSGSDGLMGMAQSLAGAGMGAAIAKLTGDTDGGSPPPTTPTAAARFRLGGAVSFVDGDHAATASIGAGTKVNSGGDIVVDSQVVDAQIGNHAISNVLAKGKSGDGSAFALSGAVNIANLTHEARTLVGSSAEISAQRIGLASDVRLPRDFSALTGAVPDFSSFDAFKDSITAAKDLITDPSDLFASYAAARGSAEEVSIGGAVSWFKASNNARTDVASGAALTTRDTRTAAWTAALDGEDPAGDARSREFAAATTVRATTDVTGLHAAGDLALKNLKDSNVGKGGTALGGSVGYIDYQNTAAAIINDGVRVDAGAGSLAVQAENKETVVALALQSGQGGSIGVSGTATALDLDSSTLAGISNRADIRAAKVGVSADEDLFVWSVAGAVAMSDSVSIGLSVAYQQMDTDTRAFVGAVPAEFVTGTGSAPIGSISTDELEVNATSGGLAGAVAAAGAVAKSKSEQLQKQEDELAAKQNAENPGFLDSLKTRALGKVTALEGMAKQADSSGSAGLTQYFDKAKGLLGSGSAPPGQGAQTPQPTFGIALSGSATVNRARQNTKADISSAVIKDTSGNGVKLDIAALSKTLLVSVSGALSVAAAGSDNSQGSASIAGGVAYGDIRNQTIAQLSDSSVDDANAVSVTARNESEQVNVGLSVGVNASSDQSTAGAAAISATVAMSHNDTAAGILGGSIRGHDSAASNVDVKAVNESKIANGGGALYFGGRAGLGAAVTYAEVGDSTRAAISGAQIEDVQDVRVRAADASRIIAAAASGGASTQNNGVAVAGSVLINRIASETVSSIDGGAHITASGDVEAFAGTAHINDVQASDDGCSSGFAVDYCGTSIGSIEVDANADTASSESTQVAAAGRNNARSSIIAVAGMVQVGGNNAGVAFAYNTINNTHTVSVNDATLDAGRIALSAADQSDILAVSAGIGGSTGNFTGVGSASYNAIGNTTSVLVGRGLADAQGAVPRDGATLTADNIRLQASDEAFIGSLAGAATLGSKVAVGAALTINDIGNTTLALADNAQLQAGTGTVELDADNTAKILSGAVAVGAANNVAIQGSVGWSIIGNHAEAAVKDGSVQAGRLSVAADNDSRIHTLAGAVAGSGTAAIGAAVNVATIGDTTLADVDGAALEVSRALDVSAASEATTKTLAIAGALAGTASIAGSNTTNLIDNVTQARLRGVSAQGSGIAGTVSVSADTAGAAYSLGGALAVGGTAGVGVASSVNDIGGRTIAVVEDAALGSATALAVEAANSSLVRTAAVSGAGAGTAAVAGSVTTNFISTDTLASLDNSTLSNELADVTVSARDERGIDSLAGAAAVAGSVGVGAAVAYNDIGGSTAAVVTGNALQLDVRNLRVQADASGAAGGQGNRIRTVAAGLGGGGAVGGAASVAVNNMKGAVSARIEEGADVLAQDNVGVLAAQAQHIDVYAGSIGGGVSAGIGLGTVVNLVDGSTEAAILGADTRVTALGLGDALSAVDTGRRLTGNAHSNRTDAAGLDFDTVDLRTGHADVHGIAVNAATRQQVRTIGVSGALGTTPIASGAVAVMAAVSDIAGGTTALIKDAQINQHGLGTSAGPDAENIGLAATQQSVDVRASHHVASANYVAGIAASPGVFSGAGALSTNLFNSKASAGIENATISVADAVTVETNASQNALAIVVGAAAGLSGGAATGVVNTFSTDTRAHVLGGTLQAGSLAVNANSDNAASLVGGAGAFGAGVAAAGTALVNMGESVTVAQVGDAAHATTLRVARDFEVSARSRSDFNGVAVSGAGAGGAGIAGMAQVHLLENQTRARVENAVVDAIDMTVVAEDILRLTAYSGALGVGIAGTGVGAGASVAILGSTVQAEVKDSTLSASGGIEVNAGSDRAVDMVTMTAGVGATTGIGGAASLLLAGIGNRGDSDTELGGTFGSLKQLGSGQKIDAAALDGTLGAQEAGALNSRAQVDIGALQGRGDVVSASIRGGSVQARELDIAARTLMSSSNVAGGIGAGGLGVGGAFGMTGLYGSTEALLAANSTRAGAVAVVASAGDGSAGNAAGLDIFAGGAGLVGVGAAIGMAQLEQTVTATVAGDLQAGSQGKLLEVRASDASTLDVNATGMAAGALAAGAVAATATRTANVQASVHNDSNVVGYGNVSVAARSLGGAHTSARGAAGGVLAGVSAAVALSDDSSVVRAGLGERTRMSGVGGSVDVRAEATPDVSAKAFGAALSGGLAVGAAVAEATSNTQVGARVGSGSVISNLGGLDVLASVHDGMVDARAVAGSGGLYLAGAGAFATAASTNTVLAGLDANVVVQGEAYSINANTDYARGGNLAVRAVNNSSQNADATGLSVAGLLAAGLVNAEAHSNANTRLSIGEGTLLYAGNTTLAANGRDNNRAKATAGTGGLLAGNAALAVTRTDSDTLLSIGRDAVLDVTRLDARALHDSNYGGRADSTSAGVVNASGANVNNHADSDVGLVVAEDVQIVSAGALVLRTDNNYTSTLGSELAASAAGGGVLTGSAAGVTTRLDGSSTITIGNGTLLRSGTAPAAGDGGALDIVASTRANTDERAGLTTGGAINVAVVKARTDAVLGNRVDIGNNARLQSSYMLNVGTYAATDIGATALVNTWGVLAAVGVSDADVDLDVNQQVNVGSGAKLESLHNAFVSAGQDGMNGWTSRLGANAVSQGYSRGLIAVPDSSASTTLDSTASTTLAAGSELLSGAFVSLGAYGENVFRNADGAATGYQLGFIPVTVRDSRSGGTTVGDVRVDGRVVAGRYNVLDILIDANGNLTSSGGGGDVLPFDTERELSNALKARLNASGIHDFDAISGNANHTRTIGDLYAAGGDVILHGRNIRGSGSVTAKGAPRITITNRSTDNLLLAGDILVPGYSGGNVLYTGNSNQAVGIGVSQNPGQSNALVSIRNESATGTGAIGAGGLISVTGGDLTMYNARGNIQSWGEQLAESVNIDAPNGEVGYNLGSQNWYGNVVSALWARHSVASGITNADDAAAYIANAQYGAAAAAASMSLTDYLLYGTGNTSTNPSIQIFGACRYRVGDKDCTASALGGQYYDGGVVSRHSYKDTNFLPRVNNRNLRNLLNAQPADVTNASLGKVPSTGSGVNAGSGIKITARYIDVNVALKAGRPVDYSAILVESNALRAWIAGKDSQANKGIFDVPADFVAASGSGSTRIALKYDSLNRQFIVPDISANGGGSIYLDGRIVSTSTSGSLNVVSGKGSVVIDNGLADIGLQLGNILVGNGAPGQITIRDRERNIASWYLRDGNGTVTGYQGNVDALDWRQQGVSVIGNTTAYDPRAGMYAQWTQTANIARNIHSADGVYTAENWRWVDRNGNTVFNGQQWETSQISYGNTSGDVPVFDSQLTGSFSNYRNSAVAYRCEKKNESGCRFNYGFPGSNQFNDAGTWRTRWYQSAPQNGRLTVTNTAKADNRIGINFSANDAGLLDVDSGQTIRINGVLQNTDGRTFLTSDNGGIVSVSNDAKIITNQLTLDAGGSIGIIVGAQAGQAANPLDVQMVSYTNADGATVATGNLTARAGGDIALDVDSAAKVLINAGSGGNRGDVWLRAKYDIEGAAGGNSASITGADVTLESLFGAIGSLSRPLVIDAGERIRSDGMLDGGLVSAKATGNIALRDIGGDFWVQRIESLAGDVLVEAPSGSIYSGSQRGVASFLSEAQLASLRDNLKLFQGGGQQSIISYQSQVDASYAEYFQLQSLGSVVDGRYVADSRAITLFRSLAESARGGSLDDAGVADYLAERFGRLGTVFTDAFGSGWQQESVFAAFNAGYRYDLSANSNDSPAVAARKAALLDGMTADSQWSQDQLRYVFNANALELSTGSALNAEPVIIGRNVTLKARDDLGRLDKEYTVSLDDVNRGNLSADAMLAMRLATTPGDVQMLDSAGNVLTPQQVRDGAVVVSLRIRSTAPVVLAATGEVQADVGADAYLHGSTSLALSNVTVGGDARIGSDGDITDTAGSAPGAILQVGRNLSLSALRSIMGYDGQPLRVQINGTLLLAGAGENIRLAQQTGDLRIGVVNANQDVVLDVAGGSLLSYLKGVSTLTGRDVQLSVRDDIRDEDGSALVLRIMAGGQLDGAAGGDARLSSDVDLPIGTLTAGGDLQLISSAGALRAMRLQAGGELQATGYSGVALDSVQAAGDASVSAAAGDIRIDRLNAASADIAAGGSVQLGDTTIDHVLQVLSLQATSLQAGVQISAGDSVQIEAGGFVMGTGSQLSAGRVVHIRSSADINAGQVAVTGNAAAGSVKLHADGRIQSNGDAAVNIGGGSNVLASLQAGEGIGSAAQAITVDVGRLEVARSDRGDIHLQLPNGGSVGDVVASSGALSLQGGAHVDVDLLDAATHVQLVAQSAGIDQVVAGRTLTMQTQGALDVGTLEAGTDATVTSIGSTRVGQAAVGGALDVTSGAALDIGAATVGGAATLVSSGSTTLDSLQAQGGLNATAGAALVAQSLTSGAATQLSAAEVLEVQQLRSAGDLLATAGGTLSIVDMGVDADARIEGESDVRLGQTVVAGALDVASGAALDIGTATVGGNAQLVSSGSTTLDSLQAQGGLNATAGAALVAQSLASGAATQLSAAEVLEVQQLRSAGYLLATAGGALSIVDTGVDADARIEGESDVRLGQAAVGGALDVASGAALDIGTATVGGALNVASGAALDIVTATVGGAATLVSSGSTTLDSLQVQGGLNATAGAALVAQSLASGAATQLSAAEVLEVQQLRSAGDLLATAGGALSIVDMGVDADARIEGESDVRLGQTAVGGTLDVASGAALDIGTATVGGAATLASSGSTTLDSLQAQGGLNATAGAALVAQSLTSGAATQLSAADVLEVQYLRSAGDLVASARGGLHIANANVEGQARIEGDRDVRLGQAEIAQRLTVAAGGALDVGTARVGGSAQFSSGGSSRISAFEGGSDLEVHTGTDLTIGSASAEGDVRTTSIGATDAGMLRAGSNLSANSGQTLAVATLQTAGNATLRSVGALNLGDGDVGNDALLVSAGNVGIDSLQATGALRAEARADLTARSLQSGGAMQLQAGGALQVQQLDSVGDLDADAGSLLSLVDAGVEGNARIDGGTDVQLGHVVVAQALAVNAAGELEIGNAQAGSDALLRSGGSSRIQRFEGLGDLQASAGADIGLDNAVVAGSMTLDAVESITVGTALIGVDGTWTAGSDIAADDVRVGCNFSGDAGATLVTGALQVGCNLGLASTDALRFDRLQARSGIALTSRGSDVRGRQVEAGTQLQVLAARDIDIATAGAGTGLRASSGGAQQWGAYQAGDDAQLQAGTEVTLGEGRSGTSQSIIAGGSIGFERVVAGTTAYMDAQAGSLTGGQLQAASGQLAARDTLSLAQAQVDTRLNLAASDVQARVLQSAHGEGPLTTTLTGYRDGVARRIVMDVQPRDAWLIDGLHAMEAQLATSAAKVAISDGQVQRTMTLSTPTLQLLMDNTSPMLRPVDVQLMQLDRRFHMAADGRLLDTNAYVVRFNDGFRVTSPNYNRDHIDTELDYLGESAVRYMGRMLNLRSPEQVLPVRVPAEGDEAKERDVVAPAVGGAVNLGAPN